MPPGIVLLWPTHMMTAADDKLVAVRQSYYRSQYIFAGILMSLILALTEAVTHAITFVCCTLLLTRMTMMFTAEHHLPQLSKTSVKNLGALVMTAVIVMSARQSGLINSMVNLLLAGATLWWFTLPNQLAADPKTRLAPIFKLGLCLFFLICVGFIYEQTLAYSLLFFSLIIATWVALFLCENPSFSANHTVKFIGRFTGLTIPITMLIFLLVPNLTPFWQLPKQQQATSGLSDTMTPGDIADLASSSRLAFRAAFNGANPSHQQMYWRVMTMSKFDGQTWTADLPSKNRVLQPPSSETSQYPQSSTYSIIAEPTYTNWLYALSGSVTSNRQIIENNNDTFSFFQKQTAKIKYLAQVDVRTLKNHAPFILSTAPEQLGLGKINRHLKLPENQHSRTRQLTSKWFTIAKQHSANKQQQVEHFVTQIRQYFQQNAFIYTLTPPALAGDHIDNFLFDTRQGFCAHFASASAVMLRLQGIPARVVAGYQGGEYNPKGNYFNVYDSAAHAWVEYWLADQPDAAQGRWYRFDPTAAIAPNRVLLGLGNSEVLSDDPTTQQVEYVKSVPWLNNLRQQIQSLDYYWTIWVLDFDPSRRENRLAQWFGQLNITATIITILSGVAFGLILLFAWWYRRRVRVNKDSIHYLLDQLVKQLNNYDKKKRQEKSANKGHPATDGIPNRPSQLNLSRDFSRQPNQTIEEYKRNLLDQFPELESALQDIFKLLDRQLYKTPANDTKRFISQIKKQILNIKPYP